jgi:hypothetical protein
MTNEIPVIKATRGRKPVISQLGSGLLNNKSQAGAGVAHIRSTKGRQPYNYVSKTSGKI